MANLKDIRRRIGSVKNTQQITKAMKMVAASKLRRAQMAIAGARGYSSKLSEMSSALLADLIKLSPSAGSVETQMVNLHPLYRDAKNGELDKKPRVALVVIASDRGLCGAYNSNILKLGLARRAELLQTSEVTMIVVGRKAKEFFARRKVEAETFDDFWAGKFDLKKAQVVTDRLVSAFMNGEVDAAEVCYTEFKSAISQHATSRRILPIQSDMSFLDSISADKVSDQESTAPAYIDGVKKNLLGRILPEQVRITFYSVLAECLASEFGSRMSSMDAASRNAGEVIQKLTLQANRMRQAAITTELMEIIGGAEALKG